MYLLVCVFARLPICAHPETIKIKNFFVLIVVYANGRFSRDRIVFRAKESDARARPLFMCSDRTRHYGYVAAGGAHTVTMGH